MIDMTLYGTPTNAYEYVKSMILNEALRAGIRLHIEEVNDTDCFIRDEITSIPAFKIGEEIKFFTKTDVEDFVKEVKHWILKKENYGRLHKVIVPTDFSEVADNALRYAEQFASIKGGVLELLHVYRPTSADFHQKVVVNTDLEKVYRQRLDDLYVNVEQLTKKGVLFERIFEIGFPTQTILKYAKDADNSIIIMGSTGKNQHHSFMGSVSSSIVQKSNCPVLIVPPNVTFKPIHKIAYCSKDLSLDLKVLPRLMSLVNKMNAEMYIVHVENNESYDISLLKEIWRSTYPQTNLHFTSISGKDLNESIQTFAEQNDIDLLTMSTKIRHFWDNLFHKSATKAMTYQTKIPLLVLHSTEKETV